MHFLQPLRRLGPRRRRRRQPPRDAATEPSVGLETRRQDTLSDNTQTSTDRWKDNQKRSQTDSHADIRRRGRTRTDMERDEE